MQTAKQLLDQRPDNAALSDTLYVRQQIELGLQDSREGRVTPHADVKQRFLHGIFDDHQGHTRPIPNQAAG